MTDPRFPLFGIRIVVDSEMEPDQFMIVGAHQVAMRDGKGKLLSIDMEELQARLRNDGFCVSVLDEHPEKYVRVGTEVFRKLKREAKETAPMIALEWTEDTAGRRVEYPHIVQVSPDDARAMEKCREKKDKQDG